MSTDRYAHERGTPSAPQCGRSTLSIFFDGSMLVLRGSKVQFSWAAVSGKPLGADRFDYSLERQRLRGEGPIPAGHYWIDPAELWERPWYGFGMAAPWGNYRITLHVMPATQTHGRGGFFIHGGDARGSAGCIDLTSAMDRFVVRMRELIGDRRACYIPVLVRY